MMEQILKNLLIAFGILYLLYRVGSFLVLFRTRVFGKKDADLHLYSMETATNEQFDSEKVEITGT